MLAIVTWVAVASTVSSIANLRWVAEADMEVLNAISSATDARPRTINARRTSIKVSPASEYRSRLGTVVRAVSFMTGDFDGFMRLGHLMTASVQTPWPQGRRPPR